MTLLEDLQSIDLSGIVDARVSIKLAVEDEELQAVLSGGAAQTALVGLGASLQTLRETFDQPEALLKPLVEAVAELADPLGPDDLPIEAYLEAVRQGASTLAGLLQGLDGDLNALLRPMGSSLGEMMDAVTSFTERYTQVDLRGLSRFTSLVESVEGEAPSDPQALAALALGALLPFPTDSLEAIRSALDRVLDGAKAVALPATRTRGLILALEAVASAAVTADAAQLERALRELERVRAQTIRSIRQELLALCVQIERLPIGGLLDPAVRAGQALQTGEEGILEFLEKLRFYVAQARAEVENIDPSQHLALMDSVVELVEPVLRTQIEAPIDDQVKKFEEWLRNLLRDLPIRAYRAEVSKFIHAAAQAIEDADLDRYAREVHDLLGEIQSFVDSADLGAEAQEALAVAQEAIGNSLGNVVSALGDIGAEIDAVAAQAEAILTQTAGALEAFRAAVEEITVAVDHLGIEQAAQEVVNTITELRETAEALLTVAPLPEPMRPLVEQLIDTLEGLDFELVFQPVRAAVAELEIPDEIAATVTEGLQAASEVLENLIPAELIAAIEAEVSEALDVMRGFDPTSLLDGVTAHLTEAADFIDGLDPQSSVEAIREPYQAVLEALDAVHPNKLLEPVIQAYDDLLGNIPLPSQETAVQGLSDAVGAAGERAARTLAEPIRQLLPEAEFVEPGAPPGPQQPPEPEAMRPGDLIRLFTYLPNKLREILAELDEGPAGEALRSIDALCGGLARDIREFQAEVWEIEDRLNAGLEDLLLPLAKAQIKAQLAIQANFEVGEVDVDASLAVVAQAGPGPMRSELQAEFRRALACARGAAMQAGGGIGATLERAAAALERCRLAGLGEDLDAFLVALDPEPLAAEVDALVLALLEKAPQVATQFEGAVEGAIQRFDDMLNVYNPAVQAQKFFGVVDVLREEMDLLDPRRLALELGEVHAAIRETLLAYDPAAFAAEIKAVLDEVASGIRSLDPAALLGDLSLLDDTLTSVEAALPTNALVGVGDSLSAVGEQLAELDPAGMLEAVENLGPELVEAFEEALEAIRREVIALLEALRYTSASVSVSVEVEVG